MADSAQILSAGSELPSGNSNVLYSMFLRVRSTGDGEEAIVARQTRGDVMSAERPIRNSMRRRCI
jgi:hypothetical protein